MLATDFFHVDCAVTLRLPAIHPALLRCHEGTSGETAHVLAGESGVADSSLQALLGRLPRQLFALWR